MKRIDSFFVSIKPVPGKPEECRGQVMVLIKPYDAKLQRTALVEGKTRKEFFKNLVTELLKIDD